MNSDSFSISLGAYNRLTVVKRVDFGVYLDGGDMGEILLPRRYEPEELEVGDELEVFIYLDMDERLVATTERPFAKVGDFVYLEVSWVNEYGAFLSWGLMKDLFCPFREQRKKMQVGESYVIYVYVDENSYRIVASSRVEKYLSQKCPPYGQGDEVSLLIYHKTELGFKVIIDNCYSGLVYQDQVFQHVKIGDRLKGYISVVREDGKVDVSLQPTGRKHVRDFSNVLLDYLKENKGYCSFGDKSDAETIKREFHVSKKVFKKAVGDLYKRRLIDITGESIKLK